MINRNKLSIEELDKISGGHPRIRLTGKRRKPFQIIRDIIDVVKEIVNPKKNDPQPAPQQDPQKAA